jgi:hypothetical protein
LTPLAPFNWLVLGWRDFRRAWPQSLAYGIAMAATMALVSWLAWRYGSFWFLFAMIGGFVFMAPVICIGLYAISAQLERNLPVSLARALRAGFKRYLSNEMVFALVLLVLFLVWARAGAMVSVFFPIRGNPTLADLTVYLSVGSAVGAIFAILTFSISAFSLPMIMHRRVDAVTAVITSLSCDDRCVGVSASRNRHHGSAAQACRSDRALTIMREEAGSGVGLFQHPAAVDNEIDAVNSFIVEQKFDRIDDVFGRSESPAGRP